MPVPLKVNGNATTTSSLPSKNGSRENNSSQVKRTEIKHPQSKDLPSSSSHSTSIDSRPKNRKKKQSPFRIKVGSIVALRYRSKGNHVTKVHPDGTMQDKSTCTPYSEVWVDPLPGRDEGLALVGRRIRCFFPKSVLSDEKTSRRTIEGEIISLPDYESQWRLQRLRRRQRELCTTRVELLVDTACLSAMPFLKRIHDCDASENVSEKERKRRHYEEIIRGKDKASVQITLADVSRITKRKNLTSKEENGDVVALWAIRKRMPLRIDEGKSKKGGDKANSKPNGEHAQAKNKDKERPKKRQKLEQKKTSVPMYVGDGNDSPEQQQRNWRWLIGRKDDFHLWDGTCNNVNRSEEISALIGEVLQVTPSPASSSSVTLASVTLRRMILPEHTKGGRRSEHGPLDVFDMNETDTPSIPSQEHFQKFQVPVEELVILCRRFERRTDSGEITGHQPIVRASYSSIADAFSPLASSKEEGAKSTVDVCHRCRRTFPESETKSYTYSIIEGVHAEEFIHIQNKFCATCIDAMEFQQNMCDCRYCVDAGGIEYENHFTKVIQTAGTKRKKDGDSFTDSSSQFRDASSVLRGAQWVGFHLPKAFIDASSLPDPSLKPVSKTKKRVYKMRGKALENQKSPRSAGTARKGGKPKGLGQEETAVSSQTSTLSNLSPSEDELVFKPTCCRLLPYDKESKTFSGLSKQQLTRKGSDQAGRGHATQHRNKAARRDAREKVRVHGVVPDRSEKKTTSRAARANQRRMLKDVAQTGLGLDTLAGREQNLRFDKSLIHAWGVFADEEITAGEMIVEYRGELIGNAVTEEREKEYEEAKIGSDYMFRIDATTVCDATKQGNVARFINASCNPNCYTQIITLNGVKRIVIYAKKDIEAGEELCYDYKFPLEYDESRRIKCYCGATDCRGFMNWDKKYVALPPKRESNPGISSSNTGTGPR